MKKLPKLTNRAKLKTLISAVLFFLLSSFLFPASAQAQNIVGVNIASRLSDFDKAAEIVGPGGWVYIMATPGDCGTIQEKAQAHPGVNIIIRGQTPYQKLDTDLALAWAATLANMNTPNKIYFIPSNEPNGPFPGDTMEAGALKSYVSELIGQFDEIGVRGSKVTLLSPMINQYQPNFESYLSNLGGASFFRQFDGISMNLYDTEDCGSPFCKDFYRMNASKFQEVLTRNYGVSGMPVYAVESGVVVGYPRYYDNELARFYQEAIPYWKSQGNFKMFGLFSYDPTPSDPDSAAWNLFSGTQTAQVLKSHAHGGSTSPETFDEESFRTNWLQPKLDGDQLQFCDGCGIVANLEDCIASATTAPGPIVEQIFNSQRYVDPGGEVARSDSDPATLVQTAELNRSVDGPITIKSAAYYKLFEDMTIPFARELATYLAGPFVYQGNTKINEVLTELKADFPKAVNKLGVLTKLTPLEVQDDLRRDYWKKCNDGTYCSNKNISPANEQCRTQESNECLVSDGTDIYKIEPPPERDNFETPSEYFQAYRAWQATVDGARWIEIPLVSNPYTRKVKAVGMYSTEAGCKLCGGTTFNMDVPWVSALRDLGEFFNVMLIPPSVREGRKPAPKSASLPMKKKNPNATYQLASSKPAQPSTRQSSKQILGKKALAQACTENPFNLNFGSDVRDLGGGRFEVCWEISPSVNDPNHNYCDWGYTVTVTVDGKPTGSFHEPILPAQCWAWNPTITCHMGSANPITVSAESSDQISATMGITSGLCTGPCCENFSPQNVFPAPGGPGGPGGPSCEAPEPPPFRPDGSADPIIPNDGHSLCRDDTATLTGYWEQVETGTKIINDPVLGPIEVPKYEWKCVGKCSHKFEYEVWPKVRFPFLNLIFSDLSDYLGTFQIFRPSSISDENWDWAGESLITFCHTSAMGCWPGFSAGADKDSACGGLTLESGLEIYHQPFTKPPAQCAGDTTTYGLRTFPMYIGGVKNAQEFVLTALNPPPGTLEPPVISPIPPVTPEPPSPPVPPAPPEPPAPPAPPTQPTEPTPVTPPPSFVTPGCPPQVRQVSDYVFDNYTGDLTPNSASHSDEPRKATIVSWPCKNYQVVFSQEASNDPLWVFPGGHGVRFGYYEAVASNDGLYHKFGRQTQNSKVQILSSSQADTALVKWEYYDTDASTGNQLNHAINFYTFYPYGLVMREQKFVEKFQSSGYSTTLLTPTFVNPVSKTWSNFVSQVTGGYQLAKFFDFDSAKERIYLANPQDLGATTWQNGVSKSEIEQAQGKILRVHLSGQHPYLVFGNDSGLPNESISETPLACYTNEIIGWTNNLKESLTQETLTVYPNTCPFLKISHQPQNASDGQHNFVLVGVAGSSDSDETLKQKAQEWLDSLKSQNLDL